MRRTNTILAVIGTVLAIAAALFLLDLSALYESVRSISLGAVLLAIALCLATHLTMAIRWSLIVSPSGMWIDMHEAAIALQASLFNLVTPAAVGSDAAKIVGGAHRRGGRAGSAGYVLLERLSGILTQAIVYLAVFALAGEGWGNEAFAIGALAFGAVALVIMIVIVAGGQVGRWAGRLNNRRVGERIESVTYALSSRSAAKAAAIMGTSVLVVGFWMGAVLAVTSDLGLAVSWKSVILIAILTEFARLLPISFQGIGVREGAFASLAVLAGGSAEVGFVASAIAYGLNFAVLGALGLLVSLYWVLQSKHGRAVRERRQQIP